MSPRTLLAAAVAVTLVAAIGALAARALRSDGPLDRAIAALAPGDAFSRASSAGVALTRVSAHLEDAADDCGDAGTPRCADLFTAAAFARVGAVAVLRCGRPEIFAFRAGLRDYLLSVDSGRGATPPAAPAC